MLYILTNLRSHLTAKQKGRKIYVSSDNSKGASQNSALEEKKFTYLSEQMYISIMILVDGIIPILAYWHWAWVSTKYYIILFGKYFFPFLEFNL